MIIQCEQCRTKFKLDDSKVADKKSIKVRCARCRNVFSVAATQDVPVDSASSTPNAPVFQIEDEFEATADPSLATAVDFESETLLNEEPADHSSLLDSFSFGEEEITAETPAATEDDSDFSFEPTVSVYGSDQGEAQKDSDDLDFGAFDFGDDSGDAEEPAAAVPSLDFSDNTVNEDWSAVPPKEAFGGLDFTGDDMFGDVVPTTPEEEASDAISFDLGVDGFADSMGVESGAGGQGTSLTAQDHAAENPFSLDDIDFGDDLTSVAVQQVSPEELKPSQDILFAPMVETPAKPAFDSFAETLAKAPAAPGQEEDLPPLSITSRRKESPRKSSMLVFMGIVIAGLVAFYSFWGYKTMNEEKPKMPQEQGRITVRGVEASYIKNKNDGDLLVISGEAVNEFDKSRAAIQIKGMVFGADGKEVSSKNAFCGNPLSKEQLATMTMDKIEAAMANQFGDSLANMEVASGGAIPFMIVLPKPHAGATDYGVEPVGSTVATTKEK